MTTIDGASRLDADYSFGLDDSGSQSVDIPPELALLLMMAKNKETQSGLAKQNVDQAFERLSELRDQIQEAIERAREAEESSGFWNDIAGAFGGDIATVAGIVAAVALTLSTAGVGAVALAGIAAACLATAKVGQELGWDPKVVAAIQILGSVASIAAGNPESVNNVLGTVHSIAKFTQAGATTVGGGATVVAGQYEAKAIEARADAEYHNGERDLAYDDIDDLITVLERLSKGQRFATETTMNIQAEKAQTNQTILARIGA